MSLASTQAERTNTDEAPPSTSQLRPKKPKRSARLLADAKHELEVISEGVEALGFALHGAWPPGGMRFPASLEVMLEGLQRRAGDAADRLDRGVSAPRVDADKPIPFVPTEPPLAACNDKHTIAALKENWDHLVRAVRWATDEVASAAEAEPPLFRDGAIVKAIGNGEILLARLAAPLGGSHDDAPRNAGARECVERLRDRLHVAHLASEALTKDARFTDSLGELVREMSDLEETLEIASRGRE